MTERRSSVERDTSETRITLTINLDGSGTANVHTGIGFLDHMLAAFARHGLFDVTAQVVGDLHVDAHHTVEDTAIVLGRAFAQALGDRRGIVRAAHSYVPMDESLAFIAVDISGRGYAVIDAPLTGRLVGSVDADLFRHFLACFAVEARLNLHARVIAGGNDHHVVEALFKALGRSLDAATRIDPRIVDQVPSTKGSITG